MQIYDSSTFIFFQVWIQKRDFLQLNLIPKDNCILSIQLSESEKNSNGSKVQAIHQQLKSWGRHVDTLLHNE